MYLNSKFKFIYSDFEKIPHTHLEWLCGTVARIQMKNQSAFWWTSVFFVLFRSDGFARLLVGARSSNYRKIETKIMLNCILF